MKSHLFNKYDFFLFGIVGLLAYGFEGSLQPSRILITIAFVTLWKSKPVRGLWSLVFIGSVWVLWGAFTLLWTPAFDSGTKQIVGIACGIAAAITAALCFVNSRSGWDAVRRGWCAAFSATVPIALYEIATDRHLPSSYGHIETGGIDSHTFLYASVTFGNRNGYVSFICLAFPAILFSALLTRSSLWRIVYGAMAALAAGLVLMDASRLGILTLIIEWTLTMWVNRAHRSRVRTLLFATLVLVVGVGWQLRDVSVQAEARILVLLAGEDGSARYNLLLNGIELIWDTHGIGVGAGGFETEMNSNHAPYDTGGAENAHNVWIEIASEYGLVIFAAFAGWIVMCWLRISAGLRRSRFQTESTTQSLAYGLVVIPSIIPIGLMHSDILTGTMFWVAIGILASLAAYAPRRAFDPHAPQNQLGVGTPLCAEVPR